MPRKYLSFSKSCLKVAKEVLFEFLNTNLTIACNNNVIHINNQINTLFCRDMMIEN